MGQQQGPIRLELTLVPAACTCGMCDGNETTLQVMVKTPHKSTECTELVRTPEAKAIFAKMMELAGLAQKACDDNAPRNREREAKAEEATRGIQGVVEGLFRRPTRPTKAGSA